MQPLYVETHRLPNGQLVKYGHCYFRSHKYPERDLWYVAFREAYPGDQSGTFVVDKICTSADFLDRMSNDHQKWVIICWCKLAEGNEVHWDQIQTGAELPYLSSESGFALDSPYLPFSVEEIFTRIQRYESEFDRQREEYTRSSKPSIWTGVFGGGTKPLHAMSGEERENLEKFWRDKARQTWANAPQK